MVILVRNMERESIWFINVLNLNARIRNMSFSGRAQSDLSGQRTGSNGSLDRFESLDRSEGHSGHI